MKKNHLVNDLARTQGTNPAEAADKLDQAITQLIRNLKKGREAHLPGIGRIVPGDIWTLRSEESQPDSATAGTPALPQDGGHGPDKQ